MSIMKNSFNNYPKSWENTLESGIDVGQEINVGPGNFFKKNKCIGPWIRVGLG